MTRYKTETRPGLVTL